MFTLDIKKSIFRYLVVTILLITLNYVYSLFSHNVSSEYMTYMFIYPLVCGLFVNLISISNKNIEKTKAFYIGKNIINYGVATLVVRSFIKGVFQIAGTNSKYLIYYTYVGIVLLAIGIIILLLSNFNFIGKLNKYRYILYNKK